jgi:hypothetical protein
MWGTKRRAERPAFFVQINTTRELFLNGGIMDSHDSLCYSSGEDRTFPYTVDIHFKRYIKRSKAEMIIRWLELWLMSHCWAEWRLEAWEDQSHLSVRRIVIYFKSPKEAVYFKLSPEYTPEVEFKKVA